MTTVPTGSLRRLYLMQLATMQPGDIPVPGYLIQTNDGINVLIDTGCAKENIGPHAEFGGLTVEMAEQDHVLQQLTTIGLTPDDIHILVCTHFDIDHAGNHDAFPSAQLVVQRTQYVAARESDLARYTKNRPHWDQPHLRYRFVEGDTELLPGIELIESSGHVPGHQAVLVRLSDTGPVLLAIDAISKTDELDPDTRLMGPFDMDEPGVRASTRKLVTLAQREGVTLIVHGHDTEQWKTLRKAPDFYT
jgi:N-acyl homoserine lactone hydrolase